jgi:hypothetical protein
VADNADNVATPRSDYKTYLPAWELVADAAAGAAAVKAQTVKYLPKPNPKDISEENRMRYEQYLLRAVYYNATGRTLQGLLGLAFNQTPEVKLPRAIEYLRKDADGAGVTLEQKGQKTLGELLKTGRAGLLVDYPQTGGVASKADEASGDVRALICLYGATDIINWRTARRGGKTLLSMVVLRESYELDAQWVAIVKDQYRVLRLTDAGYTQEVWRQSADRPDEWVRFSGPDLITRGDGRPWDQIPFQFIGASDNDDDIDGSPLYDLATLNLAHYRNSADYEDSVYFVGQPTVYVTGLTESWLDLMTASGGNKPEGGLYIGARKVMALPQGSTAGMLQAEPNTLARNAMIDKEAQMAALGARLLLVGGQVKTAYQARSEDSSAHSVLKLCCNNVSAALTQALAWCAAFQNAPIAESPAPGSEDVLFQINTEFVTDQLDAPTLTVLLQMLQAGKLPESDFWAQLKDVGLIDPAKSDDDIREEIESQQPTGGSTLFGTPAGGESGGEDEAGSGPGREAARGTTPSGAASGATA